MAITKRKNGTYQVKVLASDRSWKTKTFALKRDAEIYEGQLKHQRHSGLLISSDRDIFFDDYFWQWFEVVRHQATPGWRKHQERLYSKYVAGAVGGRKLGSINPRIISELLSSTQERGLSAQTVLHIYNMLRKAFSDAIEVFQLLHKNPVHKSFRPKVPRKEARYLSLDELKKLLMHAQGTPYELAVWLGVYMGLRVGEVQAMRWEDIDLKEGIIHVRRSYARLENVFRDYPKGKRQHSHKLPKELLHIIKQAKLKATNELVAAPAGCTMLDYSRFRKTLKGYCKHLGITSIATHGLRHSSSELWMDAGASRDDLRLLFDHKDSRTTDRYIHDKGSRLEKVAGEMSLFGNVSHLFPKQKRKVKRGAVSN